MGIGEAKIKKRCKERKETVGENWLIYFGRLQVIINIRHEIEAQGEGDKYRKIGK